MNLRGIFAGNLKRWRQERQLSQEALADAADIDRTYVSALEREVYSVSIDTLEKLAKALEVSPDQLLQQDRASR